MIAKAGKPMVKVVPIDAATEGQMQRIGFTECLIEVPDDFDRISAEEIEALFGGKK